MLSSLPPSSALAGAQLRRFLAAPTPRGHDCPDVHVQGSLGGAPAQQGAPAAHSLRPASPHPTNAAEAGAVPEVDLVMPRYDTPRRGRAPERLRSGATPLRSPTGGGQLRRPSHRTTPCSALYGCASTGGHLAAAGRAAHLELMPLRTPAAPTTALCGGSGRRSTHLGTSRRQKHVRADGGAGNWHRRRLRDGRAVPLLLVWAVQRPPARTWGLHRPVASSGLRSVILAVPLPRGHAAALFAATPTPAITLSASPPLWPSSPGGRLHAGQMSMAERAWTSQPPVDVGIHRHAEAGRASVAAPRRIAATSSTLRARG